MSQQIDKLQRAMTDWLKRNQLEGDTAFYSPQQWTSRGETGLQNAQLVLTFEGDLFTVLNYGAREDKHDELWELVQSFGYYFEFGDHWNLGFYLDDKHAAEPPRSISYNEMLADPRWQRKSEAVKKRANYACQDCGRTGMQLDAHHCYYVFGFRPWEYALDSLRCVCRDCHRARAEAEVRLRSFMAQLTTKELTTVREGLENGIENFDRNAVMSLLSAVGPPMFKPKRESIMLAALDLLNAERRTE